MAKVEVKRRKRRRAFLPFDVWFAQAPRSAADQEMFWNLVGAVVDLGVDIEICPADLAQLAKLRAGA